MSGVGLRVYRGRPALRIAALMACTLWLVGVEVGPGLHVALHDRLRPHVHDGATGPVVTVHFDDGWHSHGTAGHVHGFGAPIDDPDPGRAGFHAPVPFDPGHPGHSLAHHALAIAPPPVALTAPLPVARTIVGVAHRVGQLGAAQRRPDACARAPPLTSLAT